eukprot:TCONS_00026397-protein
MSLKSIKFGVEDGKGFLVKNLALDVNVSTNEKLAENPTPTATRTGATDTDSRISVEEENCKNTEKTKVLFIGNIPKHYRSADLRTFFSEFIEKGAFDCFHYRHRPESTKVKQASEINNEGHKDKEEKSTCCCIIKIRNTFVKKFQQKYHKRRWYGAERLYSDKTLCIILEINVDSTQPKKYLSKKEMLNDKHLENQDIRLEDFASLIEFDPPLNIMPHGNVGTPTKHFRAMIAKCALPGSVIKSLGLSFEKGPKQYSSVEMDYGEGTSKNKNTNKNNANNKEKESDENDSCPESEKPESDAEDGGDTEEWDRYNALHDDVDNQSRPKERLFEEDLEVKWEKGGSGLVFYTDAYFWNEMKGKDFDEDTVDDWDVDYSVYYEDGKIHF